MLDRQHGKIVFECDSCDEVLETDTDDFAEARQRFRVEGWHTARIAEVWLHGCPGCGRPT